MKRVLYIVVCALALSGCGSGRTKKQADTVSFPKLVQVPSVYQTVEERVDYVADHFWDDFFALSKRPELRTDTSFVFGVSREEITASVSNYLGVLQQAPMATAQRSSGKLFGRIEDIQKADPASRQYEVLTKIISRYMYDVNSPMRSEDIYLPFVRGLAASECTPDSLRAGYMHDVKMCSMNQFGQKVPDFVFRTLKGRNISLYSIEADYTMLFFSNPGCHACKGIIDEVMARGYVEDYIAAGKLAVVNVYIDEDLSAWREYAVNYPSCWLSGYDPAYVIRGDRLYNVRAIPSLYLLDAEKKVIMKDAVTENVLAFLDRI